MSSIERLALIYSDGSFGIFTDGWPEEKARDEALGADGKDSAPGERTRVARVRIEIIQDLGCPSDEHDGRQRCPTCGGKR